MNEMTRSGIRPLLRGVFFGGLTALLLLLLLSLPAAMIVYFSPLSEAALRGVALLIDALAAGAGGWYAARRTGNRGLLCGGLTAVVLLAVILLTGPRPEAVTAQILCCALPALAGGIVGVR